jgi:outer membrane receptor protein involved in Fe transport
MVSQYLKDEIGSGVDGVGQQSRMNDINPNDISNLKVLKGAPAAALWGITELF